MKLRINPLFWLMTMVVGTMIFPFRAAAETQTTTPPGFEFTTFSSWTNGPCLTFQGHASITGSVLRVSPSLEGTVGSAWHCNKQPLANGFSTEFVFRISDIGCWSSLPQCGGDGIGFILQNVGLHAIAMDSGMTRGFTNASVAVTFDTFWNWPGSYDLEPGDNFVGIAVNQQWVATRDLTPLGINLSDGTAHKAGIYCSGTQLLILLDNQCIMTNDLGQAAFAQAADAAGMSWVGFGAAGGAAWENHDVLSWSFAPRPGNSPQIVLQPTNQTVTAGSDARFSVTAEGTAPILYQWFFQDAVLPGQTSTALVLTNVQAAQQGRYFVMASNAYGVAFSSNAWLTVLDTPSYPGFAYSNFLGAPCINLQGQAAITVSNGALRVSPSLEGTVGSAWHCNKQPLANGFSTEFVFRISDIGCWPSLPQCGGDGIGFILQNVGTRAIGPDSGMVRGFTNASVAVAFDTFWNWPGSYDLEPGDNFVGIAVNQQWVATRDLTPLGINLSDGTAHKAGIYCSGTQLLIFLDNQCIMTNDLGQAAFAQAADAAGMSWVGFGAAGGAAWENHDVLSWSFAPRPGNSPQIVLHPTNQTVTAGSDARFSVTAEGTAPILYQWFFQDAVLPGQTSTALVLTNVQVAQQGRYFVMASNAYGVAFSSNAWLTVLDTPSYPGFAYSNFLGAPCINLQGLAAVTNGVLRITPALEGSLGTAWHCAKQPLTNGFASDFVFQITDIGCWPNLPQCGGDGFGFIVQNVSPTAFTTNAMLEGGLETNNVCVTFNTFWNWPGAYYPEPGDNFVGVLVNQQWIQTTDLTPFAINLSDGLPHHAQVSFVADLLQIKIDGIPVMTNRLASAIRSGLDLAGNGWIGFGARGGAAWENHDILSWSFQSSTPPPPPASPTIVVQPQSQVVLSGETAVFEVTASGSSPLAYRWYKGGELIPAANGPELSIVNVQTNHAGVYLVIVSNQFGTAASSNAFLTVTGQPPVITLQPQTTSAYVGKALTLRVSASGSFPLAYAWSKDGNPLPGALGSAYYLPNVQMSHAGTYSVLVSNPFGSVWSSNAVVSVLLPPPCSSAPTGLVSWWRAETNVVDAWEGNNGSTYFWAKYAPGKVGQAFSNSFVYVPDSASLRLTNALTIQAWINPNPISAPISRTILAKFDYPPFVTNSNSSYYLGLTNNGLVYFAISSNGSPVSIQSLSTPQPVAQGQWNLVTATYDGTALRIYINGVLSASTNYTGGIYPGTSNLGIGGVASVTGYYLPFSGLIDEVCLFNRALSEQEIRAVYESDFTGMCLAPPVLLTQPASQSVPMGEDAVFTVSVQGTRPLSYQWRLNGVPLPSKANGPSFIIERVSFNRLGSYSVSVSNEAGSALSSNAVLTILPPLQCTESPPGLISWWPAENSGIDAAGTNHVNFSYPASYITGKVGQAFSQIFQSTRIQVPNPNALNFGSNADFSIEAWIKALPASFPPRAPYNPYTNTVIALKRLSTGQSSLPGYALSLCHGQLTFWLKAFPAAVTAPAIQVSGGPDLRDSMFHHVAVSLDRDATDGGKLYVDAQLVLTFDPTPHSGSLSNVYPFLIGSVNESYPATSFNGLIDEMAVYGRALTREEIAAVRNAGSAGRCKPLPPLITTAAATSITSTSAVLNAALNSRGMVATAWFDWGSGVISNSSPNQICAGSNQAIALQLTGLTPGQTYCFRAHATNSGGVSLGEEFAFSWSPARPHLVPATSAVADSFAVEFYGEPCQLYLLQASTNLVDWTSLGTPAALDSGRFRFVDPGSDTFGSRFYRIIAP